MGNRFTRSAKRRNARQRKPGVVSLKTEDVVVPHEVSMATLEAIINKASQGPLSEADCQLLRSVSHTLHTVTQQLENKSTTISRLRKLLFGDQTESLKNVEKDNTPKEPPQDEPSTTPKKPPDAGHGRNGADSYTGADKEQIEHESLKPGDPCPDCCKGTVYVMGKPSQRVRVTGQAPLHATVYEFQKLRCGLCGKVFTPQAAEDLGPEKYDAQAVAMIALLKYGMGVPYHRLERLEKILGIPLAASTQWETVSKQEVVFMAVNNAFIVLAAQGRVLHNDDTVMRILDRSDLKPPANSKRKGIFTSGIVSIDGDHQIALFFTGHQHAGENLADILKHRAQASETPIQMADGLSRNIPKDFETLLANCLAHGRRKFVDIYGDFPSECHHVLNALAQVYHNDTQASQDGLSEQPRLAYHQQHSGPVMTELKTWMQQQLDEHEVEPNSGLGEAIRYMLKHWEPLTLFLREPGCPLDNNLCERAIKKVILHRKNAYFYKTAHGAQVGDMFMSLIHTCELNGINPFDYMTVLQQQAEYVAKNPKDWMPWNYQTTLSHIEATPQP
ncbi:IS66 family transposase [Planctomycetota bacterium]